MRCCQKLLLFYSSGFYVCFEGNITLDKVLIPAFSLPVIHWLHNEKSKFFFTSNSVDVCVYNISDAHGLEHLRIHYFLI